MAEILNDPLNPNGPHVCECCSIRFESRDDAMEYHALERCLEMIDYGTLFRSAKLC